MKILEHEDGMGHSIGCQHRSKDQPQSFMPKIRTMITIGLKFIDIKRHIGRLVSFSSVHNVRDPKALVMMKDERKEHSHFQMKMIKIVKRISAVSVHTNWSQAYL